MARLKSAVMSFCICGFSIVIFLLTMLTVVHAELSVQKITDESDLPMEEWSISEPIVTQRDTSYGEIKFKAGDRVTIRAEGCVQTGGRGKTWKRYVDPQGPNSDHIYHGLVKLPGMVGLVRIQEFLASQKKYTIPSNVSGDMTLHLGYEDDDYNDNGYWGHDDGTGDQCQNVGNAKVYIRIIHPN